MGRFQVFEREAGRVPGISIEQVNALIQEAIAQLDNSLNPNLYLAKALNLQDVANRAAALANLGGIPGGEIGLVASGHGSTITVQLSDGTTSAVAVSTLDEGITVLDRANGTVYVVEASALVEVEEVQGLWVTTGAGDLSVTAQLWRSDGGTAVWLNQQATGGGGGGTVGEVNGQATISDDGNLWIVLNDGTLSIVPPVNFSSGVTFIRLSDARLLTTDGSSTLVESTDPLPDGTYRAVGAEAGDNLGQIFVVANGAAVWVNDPESEEVALIGTIVEGAVIVELFDGTTAAVSWGDIADGLRVLSPTSVEVFVFDGAVPAESAAAQPGTYGSSGIEGVDGSDLVFYAVADAKATRLNRPVGTGTVRSVNSVEPDEDGNVDIDVDLTLAAMLTGLAPPFVDRGAYDPELTYMAGDYVHETGVPNTIFVSLADSPDQPPTTVGDGWAVVRISGEMWVTVKAGAAAGATAIQQDAMDSAIATALIGRATLAQVATAIGNHVADTDPHGDRAYADTLIAANDALVFKGSLNCSTNPNYPAANCGWTYAVSVAGKIGGASGANVEVGDRLMCLVDGSVSGSQVLVGANWSIVQANLDGAVIGPSAGSLDNHVALFDGGSGRLLKSGVILGTVAALNTGSNPGDVPTNATMESALTPFSTAISGLLDDVDELDDRVTILEGEDPGGVRATVTYTTGSLADLASESSGTVAVAKAFQLLRVQADRAARVRLYATDAQRDADLARDIDTDPTGDHGVICDFVLEAGDLDYMAGSIVGASLETVPTAATPITVQNRSGSSHTVAVTLTYVGTEA